MSKKQTKKTLIEQNLGSILLESYKPNKAVFEGSPVIASFQVNVTEQGTPNQNGRIYNEAVWNQPDSFAPGGRYLDEQGKLKPMSLVGYLDHPREHQLEIDLEQAALLFSDLSLEENTWVGEVHVLDTPKGKIVKTFLDYAKYFGGGDQIGVSTRADGTTSIMETAEGVYETVDPEGFFLAAIDFVYNPSVFNANNPTLLENKGKRQSLMESIRKLAEEDKEHKEEYMEFINNNKTKEVIIEETNKEEKEDLEDDIKDKDIENKDDIENHEDDLKDDIEDKEGETKEDLEKDLKDETEGLEDDIEDEADDIKDKEDDLEDKINNLSLKVDEMLTAVRYITDWLFEIDDVETTFVTGHMEIDTLEPEAIEDEISDTEEAIEDDLEDEDIELDITDEDIENMTDDELDALLADLENF